MSGNLNNIRNKKVLIVGLGKSGIAAAQAMLCLSAEVSIQDSKKEEKIDGQLLAFLRGRGVTCYFDRVPADMGQFDMLILSPGVSPELAFIKEAQEAGVEIIGELEIAYRIGHGRYAAITGTNGKTTTTTLVGEIFKAAKRKTYVVGNIGVAVISASMDAEEDAWLVTETSSFQLETTRYFKPVVSAILNLTPDHLNRHHTMEAYGKAKAKIFENQREDGYLVINYDDKACYALAKDCKANIVPFSRKEELPFGAFVKDGQIVMKTKNGDIIEICAVDDLLIIGSHNLENALAAAAICYFAGIEPKVIADTIKSFGGVAHRLEYCGEVDGVKYYNDSKGTNVDAAVTAIRAIKKDILLIAGGDAKGQDFAELVKEFDGSIKQLILLGRDAHMIKEAAEKAGFTDFVSCKNMDECVRMAAQMAEPGDTVLLSPACASWDMYDNFEQRGDHFKQCVSGLDR
ncbi:UDP-N-acetylmuramoyl-L-alanine--D-glutamate ligase [Senimuribacter intestinalis]|uniref:UDP-N-acetylmuramoyl-L-alanine--D-glutamate ligase n=1 Tax=Senimuribacter intestinalis TaxID=2941507 RepID=UPI00203B3185|nr:UDP-N-acetylmuramoyl-L-alanine--D-glutamate ligase [Senimuribacter intestinalis]